MYTNIGSLGQSTGQGYYTRAVSALANYNDLFARAQRVADATIRANLLAQFGQSSTQDTPAYYAATVKEYVDQANSFVPTNYDVFVATTRPIHRLESLEGVLGSLAPAVAQAEQTAGILPPTQVVTKTVTQTQTVTQTVEAQFLGLPTTTWLYILGGTAAVAVVGAVVVAVAKKPRRSPSMAGLG
jgi:hypothetical protein